MAPSAETKPTEARTNRNTAETVVGGSGVGDFFTWKIFGYGIALPSNAALRCGFLFVDVSVNCADRVPDFSGDDVHG